MRAAGGTAYIAKLADGLPRMSNVGHYAGIVREKVRAATWRTQARQSPKQLSKSIAIPRMWCGACARFSTVFGH